VTGYQARIAQCTGVTDLGVLHAIEEIMRIERPTLDCLSAEAFAMEARISYRVYLQLSPADQAWYRSDGRRAS